MLQYWMLLQDLDIYDAWEDPENSVWGVGSPENSILVFHRGQCGPGLLFKAFGPKGSYFFSRLSITVFLRKHITPCDLPGGMQTRCPPPSGHAHAMLS